MQSEMTRRDAETLVAAVRQKILGLFPDGEETYEIIYAPRFRRFIEEFTKPDTRPRGIVMPFPTESR